MALVAGGSVDGQPLPAALLSQLLPPVRRLRVGAPYPSDGDEYAPLVPTGTPTSASSSSSEQAPPTSSPAAIAAKPAALISQQLPPVRGLRIALPHLSDDDERTPLVPTGKPASASSTSSDPAPTTNFAAAREAKPTSSDPAPTTNLAVATQAKPAGFLSQLFPPVRGLRVSAPYSSDDEERTPLIPTSKPVSSTSSSASASASAASTSVQAPTGAKPWRPFKRVRDVFGTWTKQGNKEPNAETDIEMAFPDAGSFPHPASSMVRANSAPPRWANGSRDGRTRRVESSIGVNIAGAGFGHASAISSVASASGQSTARSVVGTRTSSGSVLGAGSAFGSAVGDGAASGQADSMQNFKALLVAYVFFILPILLFFFPKYDNNQNHPVLQSLMDSSKVDPEKVAVLVFFVILLTAGVLGVLLAHIAQGPTVTKAVGGFTLWIIISILAFMDYILLKTVPDSLTNKLMFLSHFVITATIICLLWFKYVWPSNCCQGGTRRD